MKVLNAFLTHQSSEKVDRMVAFWTKSVPGSDVLIIYGGVRREFEKITHSHKVFVEDERLRTVRHRVEKQSYTEVFRHIAARTPGYSHVLFAEYDVMPLVPVPNLHAAYGRRMDDEHADALFSLIYEVQDTCQEVGIAYRDDVKFRQFWKALSVREEADKVFWALLPGSFWKAEVIYALAVVEESHPIYFEIYLPTLAHHLGYRLRPLSDRRFVITGGKGHDKSLDRLHTVGAIVVHPVKDVWNSGGKVEMLRFGGSGRMPCTLRFNFQHRD